jgi:hypothetical protein
LFHRSRIASNTAPSTFLGTLVDATRFIGFDVCINSGFHAEHLIMDNDLRSLLRALNLIADSERELRAKLTKAANSRSKKGARSWLRLVSTGHKNRTKTGRGCFL